jgi:hypothetical protein
MGGNMLDKPGYFNPASHRFKITSSKKYYPPLSCFIVFYRVQFPFRAVFPPPAPVEMVGDEVTSL